MREPANIDAIIRLMDRTPEEMQAQNVPAPVSERILRLRNLYAWWLANPRESDQAVIDKDMKEYGMQRMMAYNDLHLVKLLLGNLQKVSKDFARYRFDQMVLHAYEVAEADGDAKGMAAAAAAYGKFHLLDKEDPADNGYELIQPQVFIPTSDPRHLGLKRIPNVMTTIKKLIKKYTDNSMDLIKLEAEDYNDQLLEIPPMEEHTDENTPT